MKSIPNLLFLLFAAVIFSSLSCVKKPSPLKLYHVEYRITPMNNMFTKITYNDADGNPVVLTDPSQFTNGSKEISFSDKPFTARIETVLSNTTSVTVNYNLVILVEGQVQKQVSVSAPPQSTHTGLAELLIQ